MLCKQEKRSNSLLKTDITMDEVYLNSRFKISFENKDFHRKELFLRKSV